MTSELWLFSFASSLQEFYAESGFAKFLDVVLTIALIYGCLKFLGFLIGLMVSINRHCCRHRCQKKDRLYQMYGRQASTQEERSWVVISGGSEGIGFAMAKNLAVNSKFNICIVGRNKDKIEGKLKEIQDASGVNTKYVIADFEKMLDIQDYEDKLVEPLKDIDIGMLIVNAGWCQMGPFEWISLSETQKHVTLNVLHVVYMTKVLIGQIIKRFDANGQKSGVIITSSGLGLVPCPGMTAYSAGKAFDDFIARALNVELEGRVDVMSYNAGMVDSQFHHGNEQVKGNPMMITCELSAETCLRDMGYGPSTKGAFIHHGGGMPRGVQKFMFQESKKVYKLEFPEFNEEEAKKVGQVVPKTA